MFTRPALAADARPVGALTVLETALVAAFAFAAQALPAFGALAMRALAAPVMTAIEVAFG